MARPPSLIDTHPLRPYLEAALKRLPPASYVQMVEQNNGSHRLWFEQNWAARVQSRRYGGLTATPERVNKVLAGSEKYSWNFIRCLHDVLELDAWGLDWEELWRTAPGGPLRGDLDHFTATLDGASDTHSDPFGRLLACASAINAPWLEFTSPPAPNASLAPAASIQFGRGLTPETAATTGMITQQLTCGMPYQGGMVMRVTGTVFLIGREEANGAVHLLNDVLGWSDESELAQFTHHPGGVWHAVDAPGDWTLVIVQASTACLEATPHLQECKRRATVRSLPRAQQRLIAPTEIGTTELLAFARALEAATDPAAPPIFAAAQRIEMRSA